MHYVIKAEGKDERNANGPRKLCLIHSVHPVFIAPNTSDKQIFICYSSLALCVNPE